VLHRGASVPALYTKVERKNFYQQAINSIERAFMFVVAQSMSSEKTGYRAAFSVSGDELVAGRPTNEQA
jgi:hypothetical protein